ncbi:MAG: ATP-binding protein, partial [Dolichospermum sp.]
LLQQVSDKLNLEQRLIIVIDACDKINMNHQTRGVNIFYLPRYLPEKLYFILGRRPFVKDKSGLLVETPSE